MLQLVQSPNVSGLYSNPGSLAGMNCPIDATGLRQLVDRVEDVVAGDLCELYHGSCYQLVVPLLLLVHQLILWLVQRKFRPYFGGVGEVVAFRSSAVPHSPCNFHG